MGWTCVNDSQQRLYAAEEEASSPTISTEALLLIAASGVAEQQGVATCDINGAFYKADMDEFLLIALHDKEIQSLIQANKQYEKYVHKLPNGKQVIYLELINAIQTLLRSFKQLPW